MNPGMPEDLGVIAARILMAAFLGALIGLERDVHGRAAGLRTHLLVSMGAAVFMILSARVAGNAPDGTTADPGRIAAQIVTGIGFLGAGVILKEGLNIRGLTTAACLWTVAAVGMAAGGGYTFTALLTTIVALVSLTLLKHLERFYSRDSYRVLTVVTSLEVEAAGIIERIPRKNLSILSCDIERDYHARTTTTRLSIRLFQRGITDKMAHGIIRSLEGCGIELRSIRWDRP